jgi:hypothetical protein
MNPNCPTTRPFADLCAHYSRLQLLTVLADIRGLSHASFSCILCRHCRVLKLARGGIDGLGSHAGSDLAHEHSRSKRNKRKNVCVCIESILKPTGSFFVLTELWRPASHRMRKCVSLFSRPGLFGSGVFCVEISAKCLRKCA